MRRAQTRPATGRCEPQWRGATALPVRRAASARHTIAARRAAAGGPAAGTDLVGRAWAGWVARALGATRTRWGAWAWRFATTSCLTPWAPLRVPVSLRGLAVRKGSAVPRTGPTAASRHGGRMGGWAHHD